MVLQQAPSKSAVYGIAVGNPSAVKVTVFDEEKKTSYVVDAEFNTTHQPFGDPQYVGGEADYASKGAYVGGPHSTWKAFLKPTPAGGNFTITAVCTGCYEDTATPFASISVSNITWGDVWHCSGQSNMWLPVGNSFAHNDTIKNISAGKYHNIRLMAGNSGDCPGQGRDATTGLDACAWMTAPQAAISPPAHGRGAAPVPPLFNFGAACVSTLRSCLPPPVRALHVVSLCFHQHSDLPLHLPQWYFAARLSDELEAAGKLVPIGITDTAIGGQRIEEYMVNDTTLTACSDRTGTASPEWNGRLYGKQTLPFVDSTIKGWLWYRECCSFAPCMQSFLQFCSHSGWALQKPSQRSAL
jgi:hypothetical protein